MTDPANRSALRALRRSMVSGSLEMAELDALWLELFGDTPDAPWKET